MKSYQWGEGGGRTGEKVQGISSTIGRYKIDGEGKNSVGNGEAKELLCMTRELMGKLRQGRRVPGRVEQRGKSWDNRNSITNKVY